MKTGRNDRCPCGSGKKYKKCCDSPQKQGRDEVLRSCFHEACHAAVAVMLGLEAEMSITASTAGLSDTRGASFLASDNHLADMTAITRHWLSPGAGKTESQLFLESALVASAGVAAEMIMGKTMDDARQNWSYGDHKEVRARVERAGFKYADQLADRFVMAAAQMIRSVLPVITALGYELYERKVMLRAETAEALAATPRFSLVMKRAGAGVLELNLVRNTPAAAA